jgi:hypothetical protein
MGREHEVDRSLNVLAKNTVELIMITHNWCGRRHILINYCHRGYNTSNLSAVYFITLLKYELWRAEVQQTNPTWTIVRPELIVPTLTRQSVAETRRYTRICIFFDPVLSVGACDWVKNCSPVARFSVTRIWLIAEHPSSAKNACETYWSFGNTVAIWTTKARKIIFGSWSSS